MSNSRFKLAFILALLASPLPNMASAQNRTVPAISGSGQTPTLKLSTQIVVLDATVTDRRGNLLERELSKDDFTIVEDGRIQTILSFDPPSKHMVLAGSRPVVNSAEDLKKIGDAPVTILVLDELNSRFEDMSYARGMMIKYLQAQPPVLKEPAVLMIAQNTSFKQLHDYTQNRDELIGLVKKHMPEYPWRMMNSGKGGPGAVERMAQVLAALQQIAQASAGTTGRKNLIWVGNGFPSADLLGLDDRTSDTIRAALRRCTSRLLAARVTMYSINPAAGSSATLDMETSNDLDSALDDEGGDPFSTGMVSFASLAPSTGGIAFTGRNDLNNAIQEGVSKGEDYYTLSYRPTDSSGDPAKFRNIKILMKDRDLRATTRTGYYTDSAADLNPTIDKSMSAKQVKANLTLDLSSALTTTISYNGLDLSAAKSQGGVYSIHLAENGIAWSDPDPDGKQHCEATIMAAWYDTKDKLIGRVGREMVFARGSGNEGATFSLSIPLPTGVARLRLIARDALSGKMGTVDIRQF